MQCCVFTNPSSEKKRSLDAPRKRSISVVFKYIASSIPCFEEGLIVACKYNESPRTAGYEPSSKPYRWFADIIGRVAREYEMPPSSLHAHLIAC